MTFKKNFVVAVKSNGKILRERNGLCRLPFGSHYSILLKNLESRKSVVRISIDGEDVLSGNSIIVHPNDSTELMGFMKGARVTNKFKFIQKTKEISDYRGDRIDDGIIRVEFVFEKEKRLPAIWSYNYYYPCGSYTNVWYSDTTKLNCSLSDCTPSDGITVKGSQIDQCFDYGYVGNLEENSSVIIIRLRGKKEDGKAVKKPIEVRTKLTCPTCGRKSKSSNKFCGNCGTCLQ